MENARMLTLSLLNKTFENNGFSNILLDSALNSSELSPQDKRFCAALYYGVIERRITLDYVIAKYSKKSLNKLDDVVVNILRMGVYQLKYMDNVPNNAAVNESVVLTRKMKIASASGFVNAVLRGFIRDDKHIAAPPTKIEAMSVMYSAPEWLVKKLMSEYSEEIAVSLLENSVGTPPTTIRLNTTIANEQMLLTQLTGHSLSKNIYIDNCYSVESGDIVASTAFKDGFFHVQDIASQLCCMALAPKEGDIVIDVCSAPGGKAFTLAELMNNTGMVYAMDLYDNRVKLINDGIQRLKLKNVTAMKSNANEINSVLPQADKVLCDVPCSGLGVIRRKPEIKYKNAEDFEELPNIQYGILSNSSGYLKVGGELIYSTCTLNRNENDKVVDRFLSEHPNFEGVSFLENLGGPFGGTRATLAPLYFNSDGFFMAKLRRVK